MYLHMQMKRNTNAAAQGRGGRHGSSTEHRSSTALPPSSKKPRLESHSSSMLPSFKVRIYTYKDRSDRSMFDHLSALHEHWTMVMHILIQLIIIGKERETRG